MRTLITATILVSVGCLNAAASSPDDELMAEIAFAFKLRQSKSRSFAVEWTEERTPAPFVRGPNSAPHTINYRISADGDKLRQTRSSLQEDVGPAGMVHKEFTRVFDGSVRHELFVSESNRKHPGGFMDNSGQVLDELCYHHIPVTMTFRPLDKARGGIALSEWTVVERDVAVDGVSCCRLKRKVSAGLSEVLCLAIDGDFRVIRYSIDREGKWPYCQVTIRYVDCEGYGKVPIAWTGFETSNSCPLISCWIVGEATVLETNPELPASEFEYKFPPGSVVTHEVSRQHYIARLDGSLRLITEWERRKGTSYDELMRTDPPAECGD